MRLWVGQNKGCLTRVWHSLWSWLKLMRSLRAAVVSRTGIEIKPKVRWPFQTVVAMQKLLCKSFPGFGVPIEKISQPLAGMQVESLPTVTERQGVALRGSSELSCGHKPSM
jgi:hypothetical protein